jgi:lipopolysaccharide biosynthesis glycosyltransferase
MYSAVQNSKAPNIEHVFNLAYYSNSLGEQSIELLTDVARMLEVELELTCLDAVEELESIEHYPGLVFAKLLIADTVLEDFVWIDADTLLLQGWDEVCQFEPSDQLRAPVSGVPDSWVAANLDRLKQNLAVTTAFLEKIPYLNTGVLQVSPMIWQQSFSRKWKQVATKAESLGFSMADQDVINYLVKNDSGAISSKLNQIIDPRSRFETPSGIWHFAGGWKPWERTTQLRYPGKRAAQLWSAYATRLSHELLERDAETGNVFMSRWRALQSNHNQKHSLRFPKNLIYCILDRLVKDPSLGGR